MIKTLIVDDEDLGRKALEKTMKKYGECLAVDSGADAISAFKVALKQDKPYGLVLLDISLGDLSGLEVLTAMRKMEMENENSENHEAKIMMVSGNKEVQIIKDCVAAGCNDYVLKPVKQSVLATKLDTLGISPNH